MQDIEPDMEDLLRRASEAYPLKQGDDKWDEIASRIAGQNSRLAVQTKPGRSKAFYTLLLLIFACSFGLIPLYLVEQQNVSDVLKAKKHSEINTLPVSDEKDKRQISSSAHAKSITKPLIKKQVSVTYSSISAKRNHLKANEFGPVIPAVKNSNGLLNKSSLDKVNLQTKDYLKQEPDFANNNNLRTLLPNENKSIPQAAKAGLVDKSEVYPMQTGTIKPSDSPMQINRQPKENTKAAKGFYYGALIGVGLNAVKDQAFNKAGFDAGIIAGYRFSKSISLETGLLFAKKFYWTDGKYFSTAQMGSTMSAGTKVTEVHGSSRIIEFPLHLRYDFATRPNKRFYVVAGMSSYSMVEENNEYYTLLNGIKGTMHASYKKGRRYFAAAADFGFGFERDFGKKHLRFEPYLQLPIKGVGVGDLPVKTAGLRIVFTRSVH